MKFRVETEEVWIQPFLVEAESKKDARKKVELGEGRACEGEFEYSHTLDSKTWAIRPIKNQ